MWLSHQALPLQLRRDGCSGQKFNLRAGIWNSALSLSYAEERCYVDCPNHQPWGETSFLC